MTGFQCLHSRGHNCWMHELSRWAGEKRGIGVKVGCPDGNEKVKKFSLRSVTHTHKCTHAHQVPDMFQVATIELVNQHWASDLYLLMKKELDDCHMISDVASKRWEEKRKKKKKNTFATSLLRWHQIICWGQQEGWPFRLPSKVIVAHGVSEDHRVLLSQWLPKCSGSCVA